MHLLKLNLLYNVLWHFFNVNWNEGLFESHSNFRSCFCHPLPSFNNPSMMGDSHILCLVSWSVTWLFLIGGDHLALWGSVLYYIIRLQYWLKSNIVEYMTSSAQTVKGSIYMSYVSLSLRPRDCKIPGSSVKFRGCA